jgi:hypothetical protein
MAANPPAQAQYSMAAALAQLRLQELTCMAMRRTQVTQVKGTTPVNQSIGTTPVNPALQAKLLHHKGTTPVNQALPKTPVNQTKLLHHKGATPANQAKPLQPFSTWSATSCPLPTAPATSRC